MTHLTQKIKLLRDRDFSGNFDTTLSFLKQNYFSIFKALMYLAPVALIVAYFVPDMSSSYSMQFQDTESVMEYYRSLFSPTAILSYSLNAILLFLISLYVVAYMAEYSASDETNVDSSAVWSRVKSSILPVFAYSIIYSLIVAVGTIMCIIPGIMVAVYFYLYTYIYVNEKLPVTECFKRSYQLIKNNWWSTFGYMIVFGLIVSIAGAIFALPAYLGILGQVFAIDFFTSDIFSFIASLIAQLGNIILYPIQYIAIGVLYYSLRSKVDSLDAESEIDQLGSDFDNHVNTNY